MSKQVRPPSDAKKVSGELFTLTYGALVAQLIKDYEEDEDVNNQLDKMGYNIGLRIIDDFLSKNPQYGKCNDFRETVDILAKQGFRIYLGVTPTIGSWNPSYDECSLILDANPLTEFVEMPSDLHPGLNYSQMLCGAIRGALEMIHMEVQAYFVQDQLLGHSTTEIRLKYIRRLEESIPAGED